MKCRILITLLAAAAAFLSPGKAAASDTAENMDNTETAAPQGQRVIIHTTLGDIEVALYDDTPLHRDNFLKLIGEKFYDGVLFHRVVSGFVVQAGDPGSRDAKPGEMLGGGGPGYDIEAEIKSPAHFHKRGALAAAREGDDTNPERRSSGSQFYIVTGKVVPAGTLRTMERRRNMALEQEILARLTEANRDSIMALRRSRNLSGLSALQDELVLKAEEETRSHPFAFTAEQREAYTTVGGAPNLDGAYTVFGEVVRGMDVVEAIESKPTDGAERPLEDVRILSVEIVPR